MILVAVSFLFTALGLYSKNSLLRIIAGSSFIFLGLMLLISGVEVQTGVNEVIDISSNVTQISNSTAVFTTYNDYFISGISMLFIIVGMFIFISTAWAIYQDRQEWD